MIRPNPNESLEQTQIPSDTLRDPQFHLGILDQLVYTADIAGAVPLASHPDNRYPFAYPRDIASITRAWIEAIRADLNQEMVRENTVDAARFMLAVQANDGKWEQRYALDGTEKGIYIQEDNIAHGIRILSHSVFALDETDTLESADKALLDSIVKGIYDAFKYIRDELYDPNADLVESTTSIHEGRIESGYTLWMNCTTLAALRQALDALERLAISKQANAVESVDLEAIEEFASLLERGVERIFTSHGDVPRRYSPEGVIDQRPDVTLFAPYYYGLEDIFGDATDAAAVRAATALEDPQLGGLQRFLGFYRDFEAHQHGGNGPWMQYTAWHAQYRFDNGEYERGDEILATIDQYADAEGRLPEHLTTRARFESFMENEWHTNFDFEKEFDDAVLRDIPFDRIVDEAQSMKESYREMERRLDNQDFVGFARPLAWSHAEYLTALLKKRENEQ